MRLPIAAALLLALPVAGLAASTAQDAGALELFISPMGEPFRGGADSLPEQKWFQGVDANGDGKLTDNEMADDAARFFRLLDLNNDGEIDPQENERYEAVLLPEVSMSVLNARTEQDDPAFNGGKRLEREYRYGSNSVVSQFSYIVIAQPIMAADTTFNRGVSLSEFERAARSRFKLLDANGDGKIEAAELPTLARKKARKR